MTLTTRSVPLADEEVDDATGFVLGTGALRRVEKDLVQAGATQVAADQEDAVALLGQGELIVSAREAD